MTIREKVARALRHARLEDDDADVAIGAFIAAAAEQGWHMRPDEATETMRLAGRQNSGDERGRTSGPEDSMQLAWRGMGQAAPTFEWEQPSKTNA